MHNSIDNLVVLLHIFGLVFLLALHATIIGKARKSAMKIPYVVVVASLSVWLAALIAERINDASWWQYSTGVIKFIGICGLCYSVLWLGIVYLKGFQIERHIGILLTIPALLSLLIVALEPLHGWLMLSDTQSGSEYVPLFYVIVAIMILYIISGFILCLLGIRKQYHDRQPLAFLFSTGLILPIISSLIYLLKPDLLPFDITALTGVFSSVLFAYAAMHYQLLDILPIARREIFHEIESALVISRKDGMIIDCNQAFAQIYDNDRKAIIGRDFSFILNLPHDLPDQHNSLMNIKKELTAAQSMLVREIKIQTNGGIKHFEVIVQPVFSDRKKLLGRLYRLTDLSRERQLRQLLAEQNSQLETANQSLTKRAQLASDIKRMTIRNQLARELHDQLGHTIIMTISALEKIVKMADEDARWNELRNLQSHLDDLLQKSTEEEEGGSGDDNHNISRIFEILKQENKRSSLVLVTDIQGSSALIPANHNHELLQICREAITNAVKHGNANQVNIFLKINESHYDLIIVDDGDGNPGYSTGFGLAGMENRVRSMNGNLRIQSDTGGFAIFIKIPLLGDS